MRASVAFAVIFNTLQSIRNINPVQPYGGQQWWVNSNIQPVGNAVPFPAITP
jgi:hypothetical protein